MQPANSTARKAECAAPMRSPSVREVRLRGAGRSQRARQAPSKCRSPAQATELVALGSAPRTKTRPSKRPNFASQTVACRRVAEQKAARNNRSLSHNSLAQSRFSDVSSGNGSNAMQTGCGATRAFSRKPPSRAFRPFIALILKGSKGSRAVIGRRREEYPRRADSCVPKGRAWERQDTT